MSKPNTVLAEPLTLGQETVSRGTWCSGKMILLHSLLMGLVCAVVLSLVPVTHNDIVAVTMFGRLKAQFRSRLPGHSAQKSVSREVGKKADASRACTDGLDRVYVGVKNCAQTLSVTLGPSCGCVALKPQRSEPAVFADDGVSVARAIKYDDPFEDAGAQLMNEICGRTNDIVADGTTSSSVLAASLVEQLRSVDSSAGPMTDLGCDAMIVAMRAQAIPAVAESLRSLPYSGKDRELLELIVAAVSRSSVTEIEPAPATKSWLEIDCGYRMSGRVIGNALGDGLVWTRAVDRITLQDIVRAASNSLPTLLISSTIEPQAEEVLSSASVPVVAMLPSERDWQTTLQGVGNTSGANRCRVLKDGVVFDPDDRYERLQVLASQLVDTTSSFVRTKLLKQMAMLSSGVAVVHVGGRDSATQAEALLRAEDIRGSLLAAIENGVLPGGGAALFHTSRATGHGPLARASGKHISILARNAGDSPTAVTSLLASNSHLVYNAATHKILPWQEAKLLDPVSVVTSSLSSAKALATTVGSMRAAVSKPQSVHV